MVIKLFVPKMETIIGVIIESYQLKSAQKHFICLTSEISLSVWFSSVHYVNKLLSHIYITHALRCSKSLNWRSFFFTLTNQGTWRISMTRDSRASVEVW